MKSDEPQPLWLQAIPDREPWRRGRHAICFFTLLIMLGEAAFLGWSILRADLMTFFLAAALGAVACFFLYFIWIGRNWPRWIIAPFFGLAGLVTLTLSLREENGAMLLMGIGGLILFSYLALAPSVYAFARHQREHIALSESLIVALVLLLIMASLGSGLFGFYGYVVGLERDAVTFAANTFNKVFVYHDEQFLESNLSEEERAMTAHEFMARLNRSLGQPISVGELQTRFASRLVQHHIWVMASLQVPATYDSHGPVWINLQVSRIGDGWQIDHIGWSYEPRRL